MGSEISGFERKGKMKVRQLNRRQVPLNYKTLF